ncbi:NADP-dependent oxidoreductase [Rhizomonospora bruguierae]|uniref:NADP-dependent oxidoreductase n=1 Tax=Rhizomonospora bruguierae TaxID=1581705 RepID=UPI001BD09DD4|nr:NADP-dependent oxidoreductase [Micromonospora sp. NBRC 107566]
MPKAVMFDRYGDVDVLHVAEVPRPVPGAGEVLVRVRAAGINPGEIAIREGEHAERWPATFPSGQGSDLAGVVEEVGPGVSRWHPGDEVIGWTDRRASQAEYVVTNEHDLAGKPQRLPWEVAGALFVAGTTAYAAVRAVVPQQGETLVVSGAAGGVGSLAVQLARSMGATVIGLAGPANAEWLRAHGVIPVEYGEGQADRVREAAGGKVDAFIDTFGTGYVDLAVELGVPAGRVNTIRDFEAAAKYGTHMKGNSDAASAQVLADLAARLVDGRLELPVAATYPLDRVRDAYRELAERHTRGKIVLVP